MICNDKRENRLNWRSYLNVTINKIHSYLYVQRFIYICMCVYMKLNGFFVVRLT